MRLQTAAGKGELWTWGQVSALSMVSKVRWPQEVTLTSIVSQPTLSGHHALVNMPSCLSGLWFAFT